MNKKFLLIIIIIIVLIIAGLGWYLYGAKDEQSQLLALKQDYPQLVDYIDNTIKYENKLKEDETNIESYVNLGFAWKSLADWAQSAKVPNYKDYYKKALDVYAKGIEVSQRRNTLLMANAGNMAKYLEDYKLAEDYYKEAISVSPGDATYYVSLAELYEYEMKKTKEEVIAIYDEGLKRTLDVGFLQKRKESYLKRVEELNKQ